MTQQDTSNQDLLADKDDDAQHEDEDEGGDEDEDDAVERLPKPAPWIDAPTCPAWGPMESFYDQGVLEEQVMFMCGGGEWDWDRNSILQSSERSRNIKSKGRRTIFLIYHRRVGNGNKIWG